MMQVHARNKYFRSEEEKETLLKEIAELTDDFTGAELQNILYALPILYISVLFIIRYLTLIHWTGMKLGF